MRADTRHHRTRCIVRTVLRRCSHKRWTSRGLAMWVSQTKPEPSQRVQLVVMDQASLPAFSEWPYLTATDSQAFERAPCGNCGTIEGAADPKSADAFSCQRPQAVIFFGSPFLRGPAHLQCPKIIAPNVKTAVVIQITTAARFSDR
jgi:hypothetical protein